MKSSKSSSVYMHNFDSIYATDKIIITKKCQLFACMDKMYVHMFLICSDAHYINKNEAHIPCSIEELSVCFFCSSCL